ncbi:MULTISPECIES: type II secretion system protein GspM [unclassified Bradyrhizobium]|uniref:type II secretion system protein GspM n=1 Tax=unclassified Bradyrhizobium TaxID=2631580 RepID=UPI002479D493|nr:MULTISPECIES: type II secretion system protein GspM [unclassified Bradyrhizobium]WGR74547.1 type II secretion system protein GspM [Bradyrhizobium sp. ISRA426]WGR79382.1 type II secretion system protein GspM [Bradyrhizobium sp. ISRA430]WGR89719.1 type II secretion system protein GspM [Bradyrhizobium sp. ISRA432]
MNGSALLRKVFLSSPALAASLYGLVVIALLWLIANSLVDLLARYDQRNSAADMLAQFEGRPVRGERRGKNNSAAPQGSAFLDGKTVTVAGAALVQRVAEATTKVGGNVLSTQVELQSKAGFVSVVASCEIEQPAVQQLLYDLEAGLPFLFVDQLVVQAPLAVATTGEGKLRVMLTVSGQWQGSK